MQTGFPLTVYQRRRPLEYRRYFDRPNATGIDPYEGWNSNIDGW